MWLPGAASPLQVLVSCFLWPASAMTSLLSACAPFLSAAVPASRGPAACHLMSCGRLRCLPALAPRLSLANPAWGRGAEVGRTRLRALRAQRAPCV